MCVASRMTVHNASLVCLSLSSTKGSNGLWYERGCRKKIRTENESLKTLADRVGPEWVSLVLVLFIWKLQMGKAPDECYCIQWFSSASCFHGTASLTFLLFPSFLCTKKIPGQGYFTSLGPFSCQNNFNSATLLWTIIDLSFSLTLITGFGTFHQLN